MHRQLRNSLFLVLGRFTLPILVLALCCGWALDHTAQQGSGSFTPSLVNAKGSGFVEFSRGNPQVKKEKRSTVGVLPSHELAALSADYEILEVIEELPTLSGHQIVNYPRAPPSLT